MSRIWSMMDIGRRSMANSQTALATTAHNISNKSTEGYSRQRLETVTNDALGQGQLRIGMGARPGVISRVSDQFLEKNLEREGNQLGYLESRSELLGRVEQIYNEQLNEGLTHSMGRMFNAFREFANNPESLATRTEVRESAVGVAKDFHHMQAQLRDVTRDADFRIMTKVEEVNQLTKEIASLNIKIQSAELGGSVANDERDRRDQILKEISKRVNIRYAESEDGALTITAGTTAVLVSGGSSRDLYAVATPARDGKREDNVDIFYKSHDNANPVLVNSQFKGGDIGGLLQVRDEIVGGLEDHLDQVAFSMANEVNKVHSQGYDRLGRTGNLFFKAPTAKLGAAAALAVDDKLQNDVSFLAGAGEPGAPGDNRVANLLSQIETKKVMANSTATLTDFYSATVGKVGIEAQRSNTSLKSQKEIVHQLKNQRESLSGVSLDEETTHLIEYQKAYDASARLIRTVDEMLDTLLNLKKL